MSETVYDQIIQEVFRQHYSRGATEMQFERAELREAAERLGVSVPKNLGDIVYTFRYRRDLPEAVLSTAEEGKEWIIRPAGQALYCFVQVPPLSLAPNPSLAVTKVPAGTPGLIKMYAQGDEQALLAQLRYNRLLDVFTGVTCYSLQSHLRTNIPAVGQIETDEVYVGVDRSGTHYVLPVEAKRETERLGRIQFEQDLAVCAAKFAALVPRLIGACLMQDDLIALFELKDTDEGLRIIAEQHYCLVPPEELPPEEIRSYRERLGL